MHPIKSEIQKKRLEKQPETSDKSLKRDKRGSVLAEESKTFSFSYILFSVI